MWNRRLGATAATAALSVVALTGCGSSSQDDAARALRDACVDSADHLVQDGSRVYLKFSEDERKVLNATFAQEVTADNLADGSATEILADGMSLMLEIISAPTCLASEAGTPTDASGGPKVGEFPEWTVSVNEDGEYVFESTAG